MKLLRDLQPHNSLYSLSKNGLEDDLPPLEDLKPSNYGYSGNGNSIFSSVDSLYFDDDPVDKNENRTKEDTASSCSSGVLEELLAGPAPTKKTPKATKSSTSKGGTGSVGPSVPSRSKSRPCGSRVLMSGALEEISATPGSRKTRKHKKSSTRKDSSKGQKTPLSSTSRSSPSMLGLSKQSRANDAPLSNCRKKGWEVEQDDDADTDDEGLEFGSDCIEASPFPQRSMIQKAPAMTVRAEDKVSRAPRINNRKKWLMDTLTLSHRDRHGNHIKDDLSPFDETFAASFNNYGFSANGDSVFQSVDSLYLDDDAVDMKDKRTNTEKLLQKQPDLPPSSGALEQLLATPAETKSSTSNNGTKSPSLTDILELSQNSHTSLSNHRNNVWEVNNEKKSFKAKKNKKKSSISRSLHSAADSALGDNNKSQRRSKSLGCGKKGGLNCSSHGSFTKRVSPLKKNKRRDRLMDRSSHSDLSSDPCDSQASSEMMLPQTKNRRVKSSSFIEGGVKKTESSASLSARSAHGTPRATKGNRKSSPDDMMSLAISKPDREPIKKLSNDNARVEAAQPEKSCSKNQNSSQGKSSPKTSRKSSKRGDLSPTRTSKRKSRSKSLHARSSECSAGKRKGRGKSPVRSSSNLHARSTELSTTTRKFNNMSLSSSEHYRPMRSPRGIKEFEW